MGLGQRDLGGGSLDRHRSNLVLLLITSHPCRASLPVVPSESAELETRLRVSCLKIVFEVVFIEQESRYLEEERQ